MMRRLLIATLLVLTRLPASRAQILDPPSAFPESIAQIDEAYTHLQKANIGELKILRHMPQFDALAARSNENVDACVRYLAEPGHSWQQRTIASLSMRSLTLENFIGFSNQVLDLNEQGKISAYELMYAILPPRGYSRIAIHNSFDPAVRQILRRMKSVRGFSRTDIDYFDYILWGFAYFDYKQHVWRYGYDEFY